MQDQPTFYIAVFSHPSAKFDEHEVVIERRIRWDKPTTTRVARVASRAEAEAMAQSLTWDDPRLEERNPTPNFRRIEIPFQATVWLEATGREYQFQSEAEAWTFWSGQPVQFGALSVNGVKISARDSDNDGVNFFNLVGVERAF